jgi:hypothetical protein
MIARGLHLSQLQADNVVSIAAKLRSNIPAAGIPRCIGQPVLLAWQFVSCSSSMFCSLASFLHHPVVQS